MAERKAFLLRIDTELMAALEAWAQDELRSVNGQIEYLLRQSIQKRKGTQAARREETIPMARGRRGPGGARS